MADGRREGPADSRDTLYQRLFMRQRRRYIIESGSPWPGRPDPAAADTRYPNILAELEASRFTLDQMAEIARVSPEIMAAVLEDFEELEERELRRLAYHLGTDELYLSEIYLRVVSEREKRLMDELIGKAKLLEVPQLWEITRLKSELKKGKTITYSAYRWACRRLKEAVECYQKRGGKYYGVRISRITRGKPQRIS